MFSACKWGERCVRAVTGGENPQIYSRSITQRKHTTFAGQNGENIALVETRLMCQRLSCFHEVKVEPRPQGNLGRAAQFLLDSTEARNSGFPTPEQEKKQMKKISPQLGGPTWERRENLVILEFSIWSCPHSRSRHHQEINWHFTTSHDLTVVFTLATCWLVKSVK